MSSATASNVIRGQSLKSHFMPIWELALLVQSFDNFSKQMLFVIQVSNGLAWMRSVGCLCWMIFKLCKDNAVHYRNQSSISIGLTLKLASNVIFDCQLCCSLTSRRVFFVFREVISPIPFCPVLTYDCARRVVSWPLALKATEPVSEPVTQIAAELINNHIISVQQKRWV